jgi:hypothetical protein
MRGLDNAFFAFLAQAVMKCDDFIFFNLHGVSSCAGKSPQYGVSGTAWQRLPVRSVRSAV